MCLASCETQSALAICNGQPPLTYNSNPFTYGFRTISGLPCHEAKPVHQFTYSTTEPTVGQLRKQTTCTCGHITEYFIRTVTEPTTLVNVYEHDSIKPNQVTTIYNYDHTISLSILDNPSKPNYKIVMNTSPTDLYKSCLSYFNNQPFNLQSNQPIPELPHKHNPKLDSLLELIDNWESPNSGFIRKLIKSKLTYAANYYGIQPGWVYYAMKSINSTNEKLVLNFIKQGGFTSNELTKFFYKLTKP